MIYRKVTPTAAVSKPMDKNTIFQAAMATPCRSTPIAIPYATSPPKIWAKPLKENQKLTRQDCSATVYHWLEKRAKPGVTAASKRPKKKRTVTAPAKLLVAAMQQRVRPHMMTLKDEYFAKCMRCKSLFVGYSQAR